MTERVAFGSEEMDVRVVAYSDYESALFNHAKAMGDLYHGDDFSPEAALDTADLLQEATFEAVEAEAFDEITGLNSLLGEIGASAGTASHHGYTELAADFEERNDQIRQRLESLGA